MSILAYGPLAQGLLTGKYGPNTKFALNDRRSRQTYKNFHGKRFEANLMILEKIKKIAAKYNKTCTQVALRWIMGNPSITTIIVGAKTPEQIEQNVKALGWTLKPKDREDIENTTINVYEKYGIE